MPAPTAAHDGPDFTFSARRQFWSLPSEILEAFAAVFPEFTSLPRRPSKTLDVCPLRNDPVRWRLKIEGYPAVFQIRHRRPLIEEILPRTDRTYQDFQGHRKRASPK